MARQRYDIGGKWLLQNYPVDALRVGGNALLAADAARDQERQFDYNYDGLDLFPLDEQRQLLCINHEFPLPALLFPG